MPEGSIGCLRLPCFPAPTELPETKNNMWGLSDNPPCLENARIMKTVGKVLVGLSICLGAGAIMSIVFMAKPGLVPLSFPSRLILILITTVGGVTTVIVGTYLIRKEYLKDPKHLIAKRNELQSWIKDGPYEKAMDKWVNYPKELLLPDEITSFLNDLLFQHHYKLIVDNFRGGKKPLEPLLLPPQLANLKASLTKAFCDFSSFNIVYGKAPLAYELIDLNNPEVRQSFKDYLEKSLFSIFCTQYTPQYLECLIPQEHKAKVQELFQRYQTTHQDFDSRRRLMDIDHRNRMHEIDAEEARNHALIHGTNAVVNGVVQDRSGVVPAVTTGLAVGGSMMASNRASDQRRDETRDYRERVERLDREIRAFEDVLNTEWKAHVRSIPVAPSAPPPDPTPPAYPPPGGGFPPPPDVGRFTSPPPTYSPAAY